MLIQDNGSSLVLPLELAEFIIHFKHQLATTEEINSLKQYCLTQGDTPWNPSVKDILCNQPFSFTRLGIIH
jgi:hypothetical protein